MMARRSYSTYSQPNTGRVSEPPAPAQSSGFVNVLISTAIIFAFLFGVIKAGAVIQESALSSMVFADAGACQGKPFLNGVLIDASNENAFLMPPIYRVARQHIKRACSGDRAVIMRQAETKERPLVMVWQAQDDGLPSGWQTLYKDKGIAEKKRAKSFIKPFLHAVKIANDPSPMAKTYLVRSFIRFIERARQSSKGKYEIRLLWVTDSFINSEECSFYKHNLNKRKCQRFLKRSIPDLTNIFIKIARIPRKTKRFNEVAHNKWLRGFLESKGASVEIETLF